MERTDRRRQSTAVRIAIAVALVLAVSATTSCAAPSGGTTVSQGTYQGELSILNSPVVYRYDGQAGEDLNLAVFAGCCESPPVTLVAPDGSVVPVDEDRDRFTRRYMLPMTGRYTIKLRALADLEVRRYTLAVSRDEDRGAVGLGLLDPVIAGQLLTYHYAGTAGEQLNRYGVARVVAPDGSTVASNGRRTGQVTLPVDGDYRIEQTQALAALSNDLAPIDAALGRTEVPPLLPGQHVDLHYPGTASEVVGIGTTAAPVQLRLPDDSPVPDTGLPRFILPVDGRYAVTVTGTPWDGPTGTVVVLSRDLDLGLRGEGSWVASGRQVGQSFTVSYAGAAGAQVRLRTLDPPGRKPLVILSAPSGSTVTGVPDPSPPYVSDPWSTYTITETGVHQILVIPRSSADTGHIRLEIDELP